MLEALERALSGEPRVAYAFVHGSVARGTAHAGSDLDVAIGLGDTMDDADLGALIGRLEAATGRVIDLVVLDEAEPPIAYRVFRDGRILLVRDRDALVRRRARAILDYLDFKPIEELCTRGVLAAAADGR